MVHAAPACFRARDDRAVMMGVMKARADTDELEASRYRRIDASTHRRNGTLSH
jgi:hypothetical protein